jgi:hypothetical protein
MKNYKIFLFVILITVGTSCTKQEADVNTNTNSLDQYTPDQANWETFNTKAITNGGNISHAPDGISWMKPADWESAKWDGTIFNPSEMTPEEFYCAVCPSGDRIRGIREVFYKNKPFADDKNPTKAEVDEWHRIAINHLRALIGYTSEDRQSKKDHCLFARALWGDERKFTTKWDGLYQGTNGSAAGPCQGSSNSHCGATFVPNFTQQSAYLPAGHSGCSAGAGSEGVFGASKSNIPWSVKWSRSFCSALKQEGFWGGHVGPWFHREKFGFSFWDSDPNNINSIAVLRAKWGGVLMPNLYCNPATAGCNPDKSKWTKKYCK